MMSLNRWKIRCICIVLLAAVIGAQLRAAEPPHTSARDVIYGRKAGMVLTMDVFQPKEKANSAALIYLRSGDWMSAPEMPFGPEGVGEFLERGYTVFAVCHSSIPVFPLDEIVPDIHRAVRYIRHHAKEYRIDADRLAIFGESSGGHLAAHVGVSGGEGPAFPNPDVVGIGRYDPIEVEQSSKVAAFVCVCGPTDLLNYEAEGKSILEFRLPSEIRKKVKIERFTTPFEFRDFNRKTVSFARVTDVKEIRRRLKELSPASLVSVKSAPGLIIHGDKDENVPVRQAEALADRLRAAGVAVDLVIRKGAGHGVYRWQKDNKLVADWLDKRLNLQKAK